MKKAEKRRQKNMLTDFVIGITTRTEETKHDLKINESLRYNNTSRKEFIPR